MPDEETLEKESGTTEASPPSPLSDEKNRNIPSAIPSAGGSADDELIPTTEAAKVAGTSARTLKRRADLGTLRRTSVHTPFGIENRYYKRDLEKLRREIRQRRAEVAEASAEASAEVIAELRGRRAEGADPHRAGGDTRSLSVAEGAEVAKILDQKISKITEPFYKLANTLELGFSRLMDFHKQTYEQTMKFQNTMIKIETSRDRQKQKERGEAERKEREERRKNRALVIAYIVTTIIIVGVFGYMFWAMFTGKLFRW